MAAKLKDPSESRIYTFDWDTSHLATGQTISSQTTTAETGLTVSTSSIAAGSRKVNALLTGGTSGEDYTVTNTIVTSASETLVARGVVSVRQRFV